jgi:hypothetical protein
MAETTTQSRDVPIFARVIGVLQFIGGVQGVWIAVPAIFHPGGVSFMAMFLAAVYVVSVVAGVGAFRWTHYGRQLSLGVQALQLFSMATTSLGFSFVCGAGLWLAVGAGGVTTHRVLGSAFNWEIQSGWGPGIQQVPFTIGLNVIAATTFVWLLRHRPVDRATPDRAFGVNVPAASSGAIPR